MEIKVDTTLIDDLLIQASLDGITKIVSGAFIFIDGRLLLLKRNNSDVYSGFIEISGGGIEHNENIYECLEREVKEETGLTVISIDSYISCFDYSSDESKYKDRRQFNFLVTVAPGDIKLNLDEHDEYYLVNILGETLGQLNLSSKMRNAIQELKDKMEQNNN
ncbi:MAG: hypothetical protein Ta2E_02690 [Mycoplasmoidaceae bacterium]|nr:MAG: hypothetical protein Ta2E_02690 [Mycoplasmoidaceae bacterium]